MYTLFRTASILACPLLVPARSECDSATGTCPTQNEAEANSLLQATINVQMQVTPNEQEIGAQIPLGQQKQPRPTSALLPQIDDPLHGYTKHGNSSCAGRNELFMGTSSGLEDCAQKCNEDTWNGLARYAYMQASTGATGEVNLYIKALCSGYSCITPGWVKNVFANRDNPSEARCCQATTTTTTTGWNLGANINPNDGHNMGYGGPWASNQDVGSADAALTHDFVDSAQWTKPIGFVAIARHVSGICEMSKTWELKNKTRSMHDYFSTYPGRIFATGNGSQSDQPIHEDIPVEAPEGKQDDPIFGADGGLAFNWVYGNNGARISVPGSFKTPYNMPGANENCDDLHGLGNEFGADTQSGQGSAKWWHDVGMKQKDCHGTSCKIVGSDHGTRWSDDGPTWGGVQYAIYVSTNAVSFPCQGRTLTQDGVQDTTTTTTTTTTLAPSCPSSCVGGCLMSYGSCIVAGFMNQANCKKWSGQWCP